MSDKKEVEKKAAAEKKAVEKKAKADAKTEAKAVKDDADKRQEAMDEVEKKSHLHNLIPKGEKSVKVLGLVNMHCLDGSLLKKDEECMITEKEAKRLDADERDLIKRIK